MMLGRRPRSSSARAMARRVALLVMIWTIVSILNDSRLYSAGTNKDNNIQQSTTPPIFLVEAVWYSEICHAGPRYKVKIDPLTGSVVPVYPEGYVYGGATLPPVNNDDVVVGSGEDRRVLRSSRLWREVDEDSESDAILVSRNNKENNSDNIWGKEEDLAASRREQRSRSLNHGVFGDHFEEDLKPGEFYVKPCICQDSRWTFAPDAGLNQQTTALPPTVYNDTTDTIIQQPAQRSGNDYALDGNYNTDVVFHPNPNNSPHNFGLLPNNQLTYIADGAPDGDLYLCRVQAMYCGVLVDIDSDSDPIVKCYDQNMRHIIARNAWPLILLWYFGLAIICCCTVHGRTAGDYFLDRMSYFCKKFVCCFWEISYDFNDRMLNRMIRDDERERRRRNRRRRTSEEDEEEDESDLHPWYFSNQRLQFERSLMAQVQWIWRHQEYIREVSLREQGLPPPQLRLKVKRFKMEHSTSNSKEGGFSKTPPPTSITTKSSSKENDVDSPKQQQNMSVFSSRWSSNGSNGRTQPSENDNGDDRGSDAPTTAAERRSSNGSTCSSSSAENILVNKDNACCTICPNESNTENRETPIQPLSQEQEEEEFVTLDLGTENGKNANDVDGELPEEEHASDLDSLDAPTCAICFCAFEEGDRIGDLTCKHEFHIDCLKGWVQRKNACPLCNVRLGKPERPLPPRQDESNNNESGIDDSRHSLSGLLHRLNSLRHNSNSNYNTDGGGEIQIGRRVGMIGAVSAAADIAVARERAVRRSGDGR